MGGGGKGAGEGRRRSSYRRTSRLSAIGPNEKSGPPEVSPERERAQMAVVEAILALEAYTAVVREAVERCVGMYKKCRLHSERRDVLDEVTALLGPPRQGMRGYKDWRGKGSTGMQDAICNVVSGRGRVYTCVSKEGCVTSGRTATVCASSPHPCLFDNGV
jgi:hypothetical protein